MTDAEIIKLFESTGHLDHPFGENVNPNGTGVPTTLSDPRAVVAVESYQSFMGQSLEPLIAKHYPVRMSAAVRVDGQVGPAMRELFSQPRCECPDYGYAVDSRAVGGGNWAKCHNIGDFHSCSIAVDESGLPSFLRTVWSEVKRRVTAAYDEIGLRFWWDGRATVNTKISFVSSSSGWIGLAIVGNGLTCGDTIWARFLSTYKGGSSEDSIAQQWTTLVKHELGHNCGLQHSSGGVMNPSIVNGLPISWKGDPSESLLRSWYGGVPIPHEPPPGPPPNPPPGPTPPEPGEPVGSRFQMWDGTWAQVYRVFQG